MRNTTITINSSALHHNFKRVQQLAPHSKIVSMVKANAYGHGLEQCLPALTHSDAFGVACLQEALHIRQLGYTHDITLVEGIFSVDEMPIVIQHRLECVLHHHQQLEWLLQYQHEYLAQQLKVWVKLNSGMNRLGFQTQQAIQVIHRLTALGFHCVLTMHFANADEPEHTLNQQQIQQLHLVKSACPTVEVSCCNSAAIFNWPELHFDYVRPGIMLYGANPFADKTLCELGLRPVMSFCAEIIALYPIQAGEHVGYGSSVTAQRETVLAIISVGYGDGYPRAFNEINHVVIQGHMAPLFGRVSMDMSMVDVTDLIAQGLPITLGTAVELWGNQRFVDDVARCNGTIGYELLCRMTARPKRYII